MDMQNNQNQPSMGQMDMDHSKMQMDHGSMDGSMMMGGHMMHMGNLKRRFWISLLLSLPILLLSPFMGIVLPFQTSFPGSEWVVLIFATLLFFYGGQPFFAGAKGELRAHEPAMMTLITMGISVAYLYSLYSFVMQQFVNPQGHYMNFFWELASLIVIMLLGHWIEMNSVMNAGNALQKMAALLPDEAQVVDSAGQVQTIKLSDLKDGQIVLVQAGAKIPTDGVVIAGESSVNESLVTGEAKAVEKKTTDQVIGGSINGDGTLRVKVTATGENGYLAQVIKLVQQAQQEKSKAETMAALVARWLFYAALVIGILALVVWTLIAGFSYGLERMVTVLVIACPHALGLAIPLVVARSTSIAAQNGLLIRNRESLEAVRQLDYVFMDKTGTLTQGVFQVNQVVANQKLKQTELLKKFASLEANSSHPLATGILREVQNQELSYQPANHVQTIQGVGLQGEIGNETYQIVNAKYLDQHQIAYQRDQFKQLAAAGNSISYLIKNHQVLGLVAQGDVLRPEATQLIKTLQTMHITPVMLTGDNELTAQRVAKQLGGIAYQSQLLPDDKEQIVKSYQQQGHHVMMVGDGINDAPSLTRADIGVAIGAGTEVAIDSADVVLVHSNPDDIVNFLNLATATNRKMVQNLWWGAGYNIIAMPLAAGVLAPIGIVLSPAIGAIIMSLSTVVVSINAFLLRLNKID
ncbi:Lead, cadmium, zinc and mercury transporting ATPase [Fructilactobacillus florum 8D]|uniref:P-type Cu(+) transporter n=1 Tax=Fructilactobacillus florum 8D TaxID=1221538 RepID=W9EHT8_9LACO|nr:heavy metal translocating P-type ATPase [Fructilactobacillus florum]ETO40821.1 Lead, cadmium, zinc and mercury transporting ATPase [Fructilactobacillus florum 8D]